ncbi:unnamed protein product [Moneuplotes crassus]|uniref:EF-hand domain-containing protein n=1 Tax=Euplotes crassus TaxID=5936 RepID=A0AAD1XYA9_EUPCR|nr:unnamed protein product [Moneuplotes crassus]
MSSQKPEEYLENQNIRKELAEAINLVLENRPENPLFFIYNYFTTHLDNSTSSLGKAYNILTMNRNENLNSMTIFEAYQLINANQDNSEIKKLVQMLMSDYPQSIIFPNDKVTIFRIPEDKALDFNQFEALIRSINMFQTYLDELEGIFKHLDYKNTGKVSKEELFLAIEKLETVNSSESPDFIPLKIPTAAELSNVCDGVKQADGDYYTYDEFLQILMNIYNLDDSDDDED